MRFFLLFVLFVVKSFSDPDTDSDPDPDSEDDPDPDGNGETVGRAGCSKEG